MGGIKMEISALAATAFLLLIVSCNTRIDTTQYPVPTFSNTNNPFNKNVELSLSIIETGFAKTSEAFVFRGGSLLKTRKLSHISVLIQHPKGTFVFDTGLGSEIKGQFHDRFSFIDRQLFKFTQLSTLQEALIKRNFSPDSIDFIIPSHLHFDHASGIEDFPNAEVWTTREEFYHATSDNANPPAFIKEQYDAGFIKWKFLKFDSTRYEIFQESYDIFNDGTVILVKLPGHTEGSLGMIVNLKSGKRFFFTGDLTWAKEAFINPAEKHFIPRAKVDGNREQVKEFIVKIHHLIQKKPEIQIVPAHDYNAQRKIAHFPSVEQ